MTPAGSSSAQGKKAGKQRRKGNKGKELPALRKPEVQAVVGDGNCAFRAVVQAAHVVDNKGEPYTIHSCDSARSKLACVIGNLPICFLKGE